MDDQQRLAPLERRLLMLRGRRSTAQFVLLVTGISIGLSVIVTAAVSVLAGVSDEQLRLALITGVIVPAVVAPIASFGAGRLLDTLHSVVNELDELAHVDALTGESNRRHFFSVAQAMLVPTQEHPVVLVGMIDVDEFKVVNDTLGHAAGDAILQKLARQLRHSAGDDAIIGRLGGDEFGLVVPVGADAETRVASIEKACETIMLSETDGARATVGLIDATGMDLDDALRKADAALYRRKAGGGAVVRDADRRSI